MRKLVFALIALMAIFTLFRAVSAFADKSDPQDVSRTLLDDDSTHSPRS